jgi:hypothetical protein
MFYPDGKFQPWKDLKKACEYLTYLRTKGGA